MQPKDIAQNLHPLEAKALPAIAKHGKLPEIEKASGLKEVEAMRAAQWLENKGLVKIESVAVETVSLDKNGVAYAKDGLPERRFIKEVDPVEPKSVGRIAKETGLSEEEVSVTIGVLKKKAAIELVKEKDGTLNIILTTHGQQVKDKPFFEEKFLESLKQPRDVSSLKDEERFALQSLRKRKDIVRVEAGKDRTFSLTDLGKKVAKVAIKVEATSDSLTPNMLKSGSWKGKTFRRYDTSINVPKVTGGKRQAYSEFLHKVRLKLVEMGFIEMTGPIIETEFFNFDALFQPQNHPARTWSDTYRIVSPKQGDLPPKRIVDAVKAAHENGGRTGSKGWQYAWDPEIAKQLMPRAHDTAISPRYLSGHAGKLTIPGRYFSIVRCYRPDVIDATHGVEFSQLGGFVIGSSLNFRHLLGLLKSFAAEFTGAEEFKFFPDYFPFTEPSVQISAKHPEFGWMELCGAGIFRPEVTEPLGIKEPVIAWGFGIDRLAMMKLAINDIRQLFSHDLKFLREAPKVRI